jgi:enamine deaminase RidA (YjgF/YER057c/UK114 family)
MSEVGRINPEGLPHNRAFSQGVSISGQARMILVGGQNGVGADGAIAADDLGGQTVQALTNVELVLAEGGARLEDVVFWTIQIVAGQPLEPAFAAFHSVWGTRPNPPAISVAFVSALANPAFLVEVTAVAAMGAEAND